MPDFLPWHRPGALVVFSPAECWQQRAELLRVFGNVTPVPGEIYTVREVILSGYGSVGFRLIEIVNPQVALNDGVPHEIVFNAAEFRPARPGSIEGLAALLCPPREVRVQGFREIIDEDFEAIVGSAQR